MWVRDHYNSLTDERLSQNRRAYFIPNKPWVLCVGFGLNSIRFPNFGHKQNDKTFFICVKNNIFHLNHLIYFFYDGFFHYLWNILTLWLRGPDGFSDPLAFLSGYGLSYSHRRGKVFRVHSSSSVELKTSPKTFIFAWEKVERTSFPVERFHDSWVVINVLWAECGTGLMTLDLAHWASGVILTGF